MPVMGATSQNHERCSTGAPKLSNMREALPFCKAKPNCMPIKPKLMFHICQKLSLGFVLLIMYSCVEEDLYKSPPCHTSRAFGMTRRDAKNYLTITKYSQGFKSIVSAAKTTALLKASRPAALKSSPAICPFAALPDRFSITVTSFSPFTRLKA